MPAEANQFGIAPHTDANFLTFLAQSEVPGLQVRMPSGEWIDVPYVPDSYAVNSGDMMNRWTNGRFKSTPHRAVPPVGRHRYAIPFFLGPAHRHGDRLPADVPGARATRRAFRPITLRRVPALVVRRELQRVPAERAGRDDVLVDREGAPGPSVPIASRFVIVFVVDGLRPDSITRKDSPTLHRLRTEGVSFANSHAVFPTVTRVNAATLATGAQPGTSGIVGNQMYVPAVDSRRAFGTDDYRSLRALDAATGGRAILVPTLAERLQARGLRLAGVGSGSTGSTFLLDPRAPDGVGVLVNGYFEPGKVVAYPADVSAAILARFGPAPPKGGLADRYDAVVTWTQRVLREYVLPELRPAVVINWLTEPDHSQHGVGVGSPSARAALAHDDREIALVLKTLDTLGLAASTDVFVASDHGFTTNAGSVDVAAELIGAGLKAAPDSTDVVLAGSGQAVALHVH